MNEQQLLDWILKAFGPEDLGLARQENEFTTSEFLEAMSKLGSAMSRHTAMRILRAQVKAGRLSCRAGREAGKRVLYFSIKQPEVENEILAKGSTMAMAQIRQRPRDNR